MMEGPDRRVMEKVWSQVAISEERIKLLKKLIKIEVGVSEVEELGINIHSKFKSNQLISRVKSGENVSKEVIKSIMVIKLRDERKYLSELMKKRKRLREKLETELKKNSRPARRIFSELREKSATIKIEHRNKYKKKVDHLIQKYRDSEDEIARSIPDDMIDLGGLRIFDPDKYDEIKEEKYDVKIIGDVELDEKELKVLKLHPKFAILPRLLEGGLDVEEELANSKLRMQVSKELEEKKNLSLSHSQTKLVMEKSEEDRVLDIEIEARTRQVFDPVERTFDERRRRVTDLREFNRVTLPKPLPATEEAKIELRRDLHKNIFDKFRKENCDRKGEQESNMTREEQEGLKSLQKKIREKKIIVIKTDKSSRFAVASEESYLRMGRVHTAKDRVIKRKEVVEIEKLLNNHCVAWGKLWGSGDNHEHRSRIINSKKTNSENTADMYILLKDHKEGEKTRPIVTGCTSNTLGMSNNVASVLEAVAASEESPFESISSEDMLSKTKSYNRIILDRREKMKIGKLRDRIPGWTPEMLGTGSIPVLTSQEPAEPGPCPLRESEAESPVLDSSPSKGGANDEIFPREESNAPSDTGHLAHLGDRVPEEEEDQKLEERKEEFSEFSENLDDQEEESCLFGCDVVALFPSLTSKRTGQDHEEQAGILRI